MDERSYHKARDKSIESERKSTSEKRSREEHYNGSSSDRHHHHHHSSSSSSSSHREKRRNYGDDRSSSRYERDRASSNRHRDRSRDRWSSSNRRSSKDKDPKSTSSSSSSNRKYRRDPSKHTEDEALPLGPKADMMKTTPTTNDQPPTAPAAYYQHHQSQSQQSQPQQHHSHQQQQQQHQYSQYQPVQLDPQQQQAAESAAWGNYYGWTVQDYNNAYSTNYTAEQYQQYIQQYYQSQDPNSYYGYYDASYYQQQPSQEIPQQQQQQQQQHVQSVPPPPPPVNVNNPNSNVQPTHTQTNQLDQKDSYMGGVPEKVLDDVGYPCQTSEDPSTLFEKIGQVGEGTYGKVYKARNGKTGKLMALKRIRMKTEKDGFPITAMREIKLLQKLKHERIVELQEIMVAKGSVYMVLEYMDHDLSGILGHPNFTFEPAHAKSLVKQMLEGLAYLHHMGILHRDIKGSNLLINNKGELKIADFGLARVFEKNRAHDYTNRVITLWYRPPELLLGATAYGPAVDIWGVGCIMLEFFTGKAVFNGQDEVSQIDSIYKIMGTPSVDTWPTVKELPWYEMVRPAENYVSKFRESYQSLLSPGALELSEALLSMDPLKRPTATQALEFSYFKQELPEPIMPANLLDINGDWHEFESKQRKKQKAPPPPPSSSSAASKPNPNSKTNNNNRTKATPSSALPATRPH